MEASNEAKARIEAKLEEAACRRGEVMEQVKATAMMSALMKSSTSKSP